ncbi:MAG: cytochrome c3 family protein [Acidobacteria bacterium]|nr:cytochrome c3 family protein [Acidobacteriota bacterium]
MRAATTGALIKGGAGCVLLLLLFLAGGRNPAAAGPDQPIAFSHRLHAGELKFDCQFCHYYARRSASAGVPSVRHCMRCHEQVESKSSELQKLQTYWDQRRPVAWTKVYDLPDHVVFSHRPHVRADVECARCHGAVETMEKVEPVRQEFTMGWCVQCHRERRASLECLSCHR